jgi:ABC-type phosphate/phosphonate transport system substrate-binding protein
MTWRTVSRRTLLAAAGGFGILFSPLLAAENTETRAAIQIGMVSSLFRDMPEALVSTMMQPFGALMESQTGLPGKIVPGGDAVQLGRALAEDRVQLAVFHGIEYGWARQQFPSLRALMIAVNQQAHLRAVVVVRDGAGADEFVDLRGRALALPRRTREHCHLFLERRCQALGDPPKDFFGKVTAPATAEEAMDDVVDGAVEAAVVDGIALDSYRRRKPARFARLKAIQRSEAFPAAVVAYHPGVLDEATLRRFREGMLNANKTALGRQMMTLWKLTAFEPVPADYEQTMANILKMYPTPPATEARP